VNNVPPRSDSFYRFAVLAGLILALFALAWGRWNLGQTRERLFALRDQVIADRARGAQQRAEASRIDTYAAALPRALARDRALRSYRIPFLMGEIKRTAKRQERAHIESARLQEQVDARLGQAAELEAQRKVDVARADGVAALGLTLTVTGLLLWYIRRQRYLDASLREAAAVSDPSIEQESPWDDLAILRVPDDPAPSPTRSGSRGAPSPGSAGQPGRPQ
jgi:hypothetical protein